MPKSTVRTVELHGHRGARGLMPENTMASFREALRHGVDCIEIDIGMTEDGVVVIHHDRGLNENITRWNDVWVSKATLLKDLMSNQLLEYDVGRIKPGTRYAQSYPRQQAIDGERVPLLEELLTMPELAESKHVCLNIEIKTEPDKQDETFASEVISDTLIETLDRHLFRKRVRIQSFDWRNLVHIRKSAPDIPLSFLTAAHNIPKDIESGASCCSVQIGGVDIDGFDGSIPMAISQLGGVIWAPNYLDLKRTDVEAAHAVGLKVIVWTVNDARAMQHMLALGVDGIITDYPDIGRREIDAWDAGKC